MKVTLLGHASVFVEMKAVRCLMDPVFQDPFEDTAVVSCPRRTIALDAIPPIDLLVISHAHLDHFDIPSLAHIARTSRSCDVVCPKDHTIVYALEQLGFTKIHPEEPRRHFQFAGYELLTTHSNVTNVVEMGIVFKDALGHVLESSGHGDRARHGHEHARPGREASTSCSRCTRARTSTSSRAAGRGSRTRCTR